MLDIKRWFAKWNMEKYLEAKEIASKEVEKTFKASLLERWALGAKHNKFEYYYHHIRHYTKEAFMESDNTPQKYLMAPLTRMQRSNLAKIWMRSHSLAIEMGASAGIPRTKRICHICGDAQAIEDETHVLLKCPTYGHIREEFNTVLRYEGD